VSLADKLNTANLNAEEPRHSRTGREWGFNVEYAPHDPLTQNITLTASEQLEDEQDWTQAVKDMGGKVIPGYRVRLVEMRHNTAAWHRDAQGQDAVTRGSWWYRFMVEPIANKHNADDLIAHVEAHRPTKGTVGTGPGVFNWIAGDLQLGKSDGDGTEGIVAAFVASVDAAVLEYKRLGGKRALGLVHLAFLGDCGEGNQSQNGRNMWRTELTITEQYRLFRRLMLYAVDAFLVVCPDIEVDVVNGNHDEAQRFQATREDDGHATESAVALADALALNPKTYGRVKVFVPGKDEAVITRTVGDTIMAMTHGNKWARGKAMTWWAGMSLNWQAPGAAQILLHGHEHEFGAYGKRERTVVCCPSFEQESTWWRHKTGDVGKRGAVIFTSLGGVFKDMQVI
jgi:hypothetical protein